MLATTFNTMKQLLPNPDLKNCQDDLEGHPPKTKLDVDNVVLRRTPRRQWSFKASFATISACLLLTAVPWVYYRHKYGQPYRWPVYGDITQECLGRDSWHPVSKGQDGWPWRHESKTSLEVQLAQFSRSSGSSLLRSGGHNLRGHVKLRTSTEQRNGFATVHVKISYRQEKALELTKVCRLTQRDWQTGIITEGVGVFTPEYDRKYGYRLPTVDYHMEVILPEVENSALTIQKFDTDVPNTSHEIVNLDGKVFFKDISLKGTNGGIRAESISVNSGWFSTTNGDIEGIFNSTQNLVLMTSQAAIRADVGLVYQYASPFVNARTTDGIVAANFCLSKHRSTTYTPSYEIMTTTSNAGLEINFPDAPLDTRLKYQGKTTNGPVHASLHPAFEVLYKLRTTGREAPVVEQRPGIEDPTGKNRLRVVTGDRIDNEVFGKVLWGLYPRGEVALETSNGPITLVV